MTHPTEARLNDYADRQLAPDDAAEVAAHIETCAACRERVDAIRALGLRLDALPERIAPRRDLRAGVRERVAEPPASTRLGARAPWLRAAAVVAGLAGAAAGVWLGLAGPPDPPDPILGSYVQAADDLAATLRTRKTELSPAAVRVLDTELAVVDAAIRELERARAAGTDGDALTRQLESRYRTKLELLRGALALLEES